VTTLSDILEEAKSEPFAGNTTILNQDQFDSIQGPADPKFRARLDAALNGSADLIQANHRNSDDGLEVIEPVRVSIHTGCWYLRNITERGEMFPAGESHYSSLVEALEAAIEWWQTETWCRSVVIRRYVLNHAGGSRRLATSAFWSANVGKHTSPNGLREVAIRAKVKPNP
jgi:hypothetical protein